jgi:hypothetical protein
VPGGTPASNAVVMDLGGYLDTVTCWCLNVLVDSACRPTEWRGGYRRAMPGFVGGWSKKQVKMEVLC